MGMFSVELKEALATAFVSEINTSLGSSAIIEFFTGSMPADCEAADTGTLLATLTMDATPFIVFSGVIIRANTIPAGVIDVSGVCGHFRMKDAGGQCHLQGTCGMGSSTINFVNTTFVATEAIEVTFFQLTNQMSTLP